MGLSAHRTSALVQAASRAARGRAPLEAAVAVLLVLVGPALAGGSLEGQQAGLVISAMVGIGVALAAGKLWLRRS